MSNQQPPAGWEASQPSNANQPPSWSSPFGSHPAPQNATPHRRDTTTVGPFTLRELLVLIATGLILLSSFLPLVGGDMPEYTTIWYPFWPLGVISVLLPLGAAGLLALRRLLPGTGWRVGSLSVDQFSSVVAIVAASTYLATLAMIGAVGAAIGEAFGGFVRIVILPGVGAWLGFLFSVVLVALTTFGPLIPPFAAEFRSRAPVPAHPVARPAAPIARPQRTAQPAPGQPFGYAPAPQSSFAPSGHPGADPQSPAAWPSAAPDAEREDAAGAEASETTASPVSAANHVNAGSGAQQTSAASSTPFWVWSPVPRDVVDAASGTPIFAIGPLAWALAVEDRGTELVIRNDDGRVGVLRDIDGLTRS